MKIMKVHNFYVDLLLSLRHLFDDIIFGNGVVSSYQFNIGSRSLQLDYETQYALPAIICNFQSSTPFHYHPYITQRHWMDNHSKFPVLWDKTKQLWLVMQEEMHETVIDFVINCETQIQAIEMNHHLTNIMPIGKYIQIHHFYSYYAIDESYFQKALFDVGNDDIANLFTRYNNITDKVEHSCAVRHEPIMKIENSNVSIASQDQRSFSVQANMNILMGVPVYIEIPATCIPKYINNRIDQEVIIESARMPTTFADDDTSTTYYDIQAFKNEDDVETLVSYPIQIDDESHFENIFYDVLSDGTIDTTSAVIVSGSMSEIIEEGILYTTVNNTELTPTSTITTIITEAYPYNNEGHNFSFPKSLRTPELAVKCQLSGTMEGTLEDYRISGNILSGYFTGVINSEEYSGLIEGYYVKKHSTSKVDKITINPAHEDNTATYEFHNVPVCGDGASNIIGYDVETFQLQPEQTCLTGFNLVIDDSYLATCTLDDPVYLDSHGNFSSSFSVNYVKNIELRTSDTVSEIQEKTLDVIGRITGKMNCQSLMYTYEIEKYIDGLNFDVYELIFSMSFIDQPKFGDNRIRSVSININSDNSPITCTRKTKIFEDRFGKNVVDNRRIYRTMIISGQDQELKNMIEITDTRDVYITIEFDRYFDYDVLINNHDIKWRFVFGDRIYSSSSSVSLCDREDAPGCNILVFKWDYELYAAVFSKVALDNTLFCEIYEMID